MNSRDLIALCENLTHRKLDYWCHNGVFDTETSDHQRSGVRRTFTEEDAQIAKVLDKVSTAFDIWSGGRGGLVAIYREIAQQMRRLGTDMVDIELTDGVNVVVRIDEPLRAAAPAPAPEPDPPAEPEPVFIPGVGIDNG